jgi:lantibiotic modifying enzyme
VSEPGTYRDLGESAWRWVRAQIRDDDGPWLPDVVTDESPAGPAYDRDSVYAGIGGLVPVLAEIAQHRPLTAAERDLAGAVGARLSATVPGRREPSLYDGLAGDVTALRMLSPGREEPALRRLAQLQTPAGWATTQPIDHDGPATDLILGTAGVVLALVWAGAGETLLAVAEPTTAGLDWQMWPGYGWSSPNYSHGTAGVAAALAMAGHTLGRDDFVSAARRGAAHVLSVGSLAGGGFVVPHTIPPSRREVEPVTYGWCHGPTGTSHLFAALAHIGVPEVGGHSPADLRRRCLHSVLHSGVPQRLRPGFWDNDGRCCGTAGVGDALLDAYQDLGDADLCTGAVTMGDALVQRAVVDEAGARWRFVEYRQDPPLLPPGTSWMQGAAGIAAFLFRLARVLETGPAAPVVVRPDQWWAVPAAVRTTRGLPGLE